MNQKLYLKPKFNITGLVIITSLLVLFTIGASYSQYNNTLVKALEQRAAESLTESTSSAEKSLQKNINSIYDKLHNLVTAYDIDQTNSWNAAAFNQYISSHSNINCLGNLTFISIRTIEIQLNSTTLNPLYKEGIEKILSGNKTLFIPNTTSDILCIGIPVVRNDVIIGVLYSSYNEDNTYNIFQESTFNEKGTAILVRYDNNRLLLCGNKSTNETFPLDAVKCYHDYSLEQMHMDLESSSSGMLHYYINDISHYAFYSPAEYPHFFIINSVPADTLEADTLFFTQLAQNLIHRIIISFFILILFIIIVQIFNTKQTRKNQNYLLLEQERYQTILKHTPCAIWEYKISIDTMIKSDPDLGIHSGLSEISNVKDFFLQNELIFKDDIEKFIDFYNHLKTGPPEITAELRGRDLSGKYVWFELTGTTVYNQDGAPVSVIGQTTNIEQKKLELEELRENAKRDSLTKLYNRTAAIELINKALQEREHHLQHAFLMIDLDNFKTINDTFGHSFGDAVLIEFSSKLQKVFNSDKHILARLGGDEFIAFISNISSLSEIRKIANQISSIFHGIFSDSQNNHNLSGSIGISLYPKDGQDFHTLLEKADIALYYSKNVGKNCYSIYTPELMLSMDYLPKNIDDSMKHHLHTENNTLVDSSIIANTVDILFDAKKLDISINLILVLLGNYYNLDNLCIYELSEDENYLCLTYEWASESSIKLSDHFKQLPVELGEPYAFYKQSSNGVAYHNDISSFSYPESPYSSLIKKVHGYCLFQCAIMEQGNYKGYIEACCSSKSRSFTKTDIDSLTLVSKIIGGYLIKLRTQEAADRMSKCDLLTGANNLIQFTKEADIIREEYPEEHYVILYTDIYNFKYINDTYGYSEGDKILISYAQILAELLDDNETFGRISADYFIILLKYKNKSALHTKIDELNLQMNSIKKTDTDTHKISLVIGIYELKSDDVVSIAVDRANLARKNVVDRHKTNYLFFDDSMKSNLIKQKEIEDIMEEALLNEEFVIFYQPKFHLVSNTICGAEALVRWQRNDGTLIFPNDFIPIFEDNGFIVELDFYVFNKVCQKIRSLLDEEKHVVPISVNFSRMHLRDKTLVPRLTSIVRSYDIPFHLIEVELTESALVDDNGYLTTLLQDIHKSGFKLSMDDFGSGLSSLNLLRELPFDVLKIDKDFFQKGTTTQRERIIIEYIVKMALDLKMEIVSEGVETIEQAEFLRSIGCPIAQGYLFEKPIPEKDFILKYCK